jgi:hypothetical protein
MAKQFTSSPPVRCSNVTDLSELAETAFEAVVSVAFCLAGETSSY